MRKEFWDDALNQIDEKYINETAKAHLKRADRRAGPDGEFIDITDKPIEIRLQPVSEKSRRGQIIGVCSAAAVVALCVIGGSIWLGRGQRPPVGSDTSTDSGTSLVSGPLSGTSSPEHSGFEVDENGSIIFEKDYQQGHIEFQPADKTFWINGGGIAGSFGEMTESEIRGYIEGFSGLNYLYVGNNLRNDGFTENSADFRWNSLESSWEGRDCQYVSLYYHKEEQQIAVNISQEYGDRRYIRLPDDDIIAKPEGARPESWLENASSGVNTQIYICGRVIDGVPYYYAEFETEHDGKPIICTVSARGCSIDNIVQDVLGGLICNTESLDPVERQYIMPLAMESYHSFDMLGDEDILMPLEQHMTDYLAQILEQHSASPEYSVEAERGHEAALRANKDTFGDSFDEICLYANEDSGEYYYSYRNYSNPPYFRISRECYDELYMFFTLYMPQLEYTAVKQVLGGSSYVSESDIWFTCEQELKVGDDVVICYYGPIMESYPAQVHQLWAAYRYNIDKDDSPLPTEAPLEISWEVYEQYFAAVWESENAGTYVWDYKNISRATGFPCQRDGYGFRCYETDTGMYMHVTRGGQGTVYYINKLDPMKMYAYPAADGLTHDEYSAVYALISYADRSETELNGSLNAIGVSRFLELAGEDFTEFCYSLNDVGFTDKDGAVWKKSPSLAQDWGEFVLNSFTEDRVMFAELYYRAEELTEDALDGSAEPEGQYFLHDVQLIGGQWTLVSSAAADRSGSELPKQYSDTYTESMRSCSVTFRYNTSDRPDGTHEVRDIELFTTPKDDTDDKTYVSFTNAAMSGEGGIIPAGTRLVTQSLRLSDSYVFIVYVPITYLGEVCYYPTLYYCGENGLIIFANSTDKPVFARSAFANTSYGADIITFENIEGYAESYTIDYGKYMLGELKAPPESDTSVKTITADYSKPELNGSGFGEYVSYFFGEWGGRDGILDLRLTGGDELFGLNAPCLGWYSDNNGSYMYGESRVWFIRNDDRNTMFYFEDVSDGQTLTLAECTASYQRTVGMEGFHRGGLPLGYLGTAELQVSYGFDAYDMEFTDENGTRWIRTRDAAVDWGAVYRAEVSAYGSSGLEEEFHVKMMNADDPSEMKYFSFTPEETADGYVFTEEHYSFDMSVCDPEQTPTELLLSVQAEVKNHEYGWFTMPVTFYPVEGEKYYAVRTMGNTQAQVLSNSELYYHDENGYVLLSDEHGEFKLLNGRMYVHHDSLISIYDGGELVRDIPTLAHSNFFYSLYTVADRYVAVDGVQYEYMTIYDSVTDKYISVDADNARREYSDGGTILAVILNGREYAAVDGGMDTLKELFE